jgi:hypothetical protein
MMTITVRFGRNVTINRSLRVKDTYTSIFPSYGISPDRFETTMRKSFYKGNKGEALNKEYHCKSTEEKRYLEEWLKTVNMRRGRK